MTTYREILPSEVAVDAPLTQQLMQAFKDNPKGIAEGDDTASGVRINPKALTKTIAAGDFTILRFFGLQSTGVTPAEQTHTTIKLKFRIGGDVRIRARFAYDDTGSNDDASWAVVRTVASDSSTTNLISGSDNSGDNDYDYNITQTFLADDSLHITITTKPNATISFHLTVGCSDKDILGQAVFYTDADDSITNVGQINDFGSTINYVYNFI